MNSDTGSTESMVLDRDLPAGSPPDSLAVRVGPDPPRIDPTPLPHRNLLAYYALSSLLAGPFFFVALIPYYFRFRTLRYRFDDEGVSMQWGILFRREISLTYSRIQDIHLSSNVVERWLGLAKIQVQTASGSADAEMTIEGLQEFEPIRDFLYSRMRGARETGRGEVLPSQGATVHRSETVNAAAIDELTETLRAVTTEIQALRVALEDSRSPEREGGDG